MNNEYFIYNVSNKKEMKDVKEDIKCYYCNSSRNFDLINNRCNNCSNIIGYSKYTVEKYPNGINRREIRAVKRRFKIQKAGKFEKLESIEDREDAGTCYCSII